MVSMKEFNVKVKVFPVSGTAYRAHAMVTGCDPVLGVASPYLFATSSPQPLEAWAVTQALTKLSVAFYRRAPKSDVTPNEGK